MTRAVTIGTQVATLTAGNVTPPSPNTSLDNAPFAQLLATVQQVTNGAASAEGVAVPVDAFRPSDEQTVPASGEAEQLLAMLGLPMLLMAQSMPQTEPVASVAVPDGKPQLPPQMVLLSKLATDQPRATTPTQAPMSDAVPSQTTSASPREGLVLTQQFGEPAKAAVNPLHHSPVEPVVPPSTPAADGARLPKVEVPSQAETAMASGVTARESCPSDATAHRPSPENPVSPQNTVQPALQTTRADGAAPFQSGMGRERQDGAPTTQPAARIDAKKLRFMLIEQASAPASSDGHVIGVHNLEAIASAHRTTSASAPAPVEVPAPEIVRQVVEQIETLAHQRRADSVTLQLEPEHLGRLRVTISLSEGAIHTHIVADNQAVRQMLEGNSTLLQQALQERGLQLGALQVSVQGDGRQFHLHQPFAPSHPMGSWMDAGAKDTSESASMHATHGGVNLLV